jgi:AAA ATPase domain
MLWGRGQQCSALDGLLAEVRAGRSRVPVIRGEPGIGKTALLDYATETAQDFHVARAEGAESEMELPFAALALLCPVQVHGGLRHASRLLLERIDGATRRFRAT